MIGFTHSLYYTRQRGLWRAWSLQMFAFLTLDESPLLSWGREQSPPPPTTEQVGEYVFRRWTGLLEGLAQ